MSATCSVCGGAVEVSPQTQAKYPGWTPKECRACYGRATGGGSGGGSRRSRGGSKGGGARGSTLKEENLTVAQVLERYTGGPDSGVFTDGSSHPNPGPGGWGAVYVVDGEVVAQAHGAAESTTNNRMELTALAEGIALVPEGTPATVHTDSKLVVDTLTSWAHGWERKGWTRKGGPIKNLDLIKPLFQVVKARPELTIQWIAAHSGNRWNEYADSLSTAYLRRSV